MSLSKIAGLLHEARDLVGNKLIGGEPGDRLDKILSQLEHDLQAPRFAAYAAIDSERDYQDAGLGNAARHEGAPPHLLPGEVILCMEKCLSDAREAWYRPDGATNALPFLRKVSALGVQAMERYGAPLRD
jgi:hypothetical protein